MLNRALFQVMFRRQHKKTLNYALGLVFYNLLLIGAFPTLSKAKGMAKLSESLPKLARVFKLDSGQALNRLEPFVASQCFGQVWVLVMGIYTISTANELVAGQVSEGGMAYLLSTPAGRSEVFVTQAAVLISGLGLLVLLTGLGLWGEVAWFGLELPGKSYRDLGLGALALFLTVGSYSLLFSSIFANQEQVILCAAGLTFAMYAMDILAGLDDQFAWLSKLSVFSCFRPQDVLKGKGGGQTRFLFILSGLLLKLAERVFAGKDLLI